MYAVFFGFVRNDQNQMRCYDPIVFFRRRGRFSLDKFLSGLDNGSTLLFIKKNRPVVTIRRDLSAHELTVPSVPESQEEALGEPCGQRERETEDAEPQSSVNGAAAPQTPAVQTAEEACPDEKTMIEDEDFEEEGSESSSLHEPSSVSGSGSDSSSLSKGSSSVVADRSGDEPPAIQPAACLPWIGRVVSRADLKPPAPRKDGPPSAPAVVTAEEACPDEKAMIEDEDFEEEASESSSLHEPSSVSGSGSDSSSLSKGSSSVVADRSGDEPLAIQPAACLPWIGRVVSRADLKPPAPRKGFPQWSDLWYRVDLNGSRDKSTPPSSTKAAGTHQENSTETKDLKARAEILVSELVRFSGCGFVSAEFRFKLGQMLVSFALTSEAACTLARETLDREMLRLRREESSPQTLIYLYRFIKRFPMIFIGMKCQLHQWVLEDLEDPDLVSEDEDGPAEIAPADAPAEGPLLPAPLAVPEPPPGLLFLPSPAPQPSVEVLSSRPPAPAPQPSVEVLSSPAPLAVPEPPPGLLFFPAPSPALQPSVEVLSSRPPAPAPQPSVEVLSSPAPLAVPEPPPGLLFFPAPSPALQPSVEVLSFRPPAPAPQPSVEVLSSPAPLAVPEPPPGLLFFPAPSPALQPSVEVLSSRPPAPAPQPSVEVLSSPAPLAVPEPPPGLLFFPAPSPAPQPSVEVLSSPAPLAVPEPPPGLLYSPPPAPAPQASVEVLSSRPPAPAPQPSVEVLSFPAPLAVSEPPPGLLFFPAPAPQPSVEVLYSPPPAPAPQPSVEVLSFPAPLAVPEPPPGLLFFPGSAPAPQPSVEVLSFPPPAPAPQPLVEVLSSPPSAPAPKRARLCPSISGIKAQPSSPYSPLVSVSPPQLPPSFQYTDKIVYMEVGNTPSSSQLSPPHGQVTPLASPPSLPPSRKRRAPSCSQQSIRVQGEAEVSPKRARLCPSISDIKAQPSSPNGPLVSVLPPQPQMPPSFQYTDKIVYMEVGNTPSSSQISPPEHQAPPLASPPSRKRRAPSSTEDEMEPAPKRAKLYGLSARVTPPLSQTPSSSQQIKVNATKVNRSSVSQPSSNHNQKIQQVPPPKSPPRRCCKRPPPCSSQEASEGMVSMKKKPRLNGLF
ncbi:uncharacterized protein [Misgurnus anguillicaudatus]|uniref:uncharacterized protein isoform X1 n=1 Tax=Misgurnus anguillicaudatus TaxID=75329 RepID=UPI003CCFA821